MKKSQTLSPERSKRKPQRDLLTRSRALKVILALPLSSSAKQVACEILDHLGDKGSFVSVGSMARRLAIKVITVKRATNELDEMDLILKQSHGGPHGTCRYIVNFDYIEELADDYESRRKGSLPPDIGSPFVRRPKVSDLIPVLDTHRGQFGKEYVSDPISRGINHDTETQSNNSVPKLFGSPPTAHPNGRGERRAEATRKNLRAPSGVASADEKELGDKTGYAPKWRTEVMELVSAASSNSHFPKTDSPQTRENAAMHRLSSDLIALGTSYYAFAISNEKIFWEGVTAELANEGSGARLIKTLVDAMITTAN